MNIAHRPLSPNSPGDRIDRFPPRDDKATRKDPPPPLTGPWGQGNLPTPPDTDANGMNGYMNGGGRQRRPGGGGGGGYGNEGRYGGGGGFGPSDRTPDAPPPAPYSVSDNRMSAMSNGTQMSGTDADRRRKQGMMEDSLAQHYGVLKRYLGSSLQEDQDSNKPNRARDKLIRLSAVQFQELSTDVYDELLRRQAAQRGGNAPEALPPRDNFHPKRNQARQKLSTLPAGRFRALATDVYYELERRFPRFVAGNMERMGSPRLAPPSRTGSPGFPRPDSRNQMGARRGPGARQQGSFGQSSRDMPGMMPKSSQSNTAIPNKSYMVEEEEGDLDSVYNNRRDTVTTNKSQAVSDKIAQEYQGQIQELNAKVSRLEGQLQESEQDVQDKDRLLQDKDRTLRDKDDELDRLEERTRSSARTNDAAEQEWGGLRSKLENQVSDAQALNQNLQSEIDRIKAQNQDREDDFRNQLDTVTRKNNDGGEWRMRFNEMQLETSGLKRENVELQEQLRKQQTSTQSVRRELEGFLAEMKTIADHSGSSLQREERLMAQVRTLEADLRTWKNRCATMKTQLRQADNIALDQPDVLKEAFVRPDGMIQYVHVTSFQLAIDDTLRMARVRDTSALLETLRTVVVAIKNICDDVPGSAPAQATQQRIKVSAMANNLITATKNFAAAKGLSPVSLVDAAAANLATSIVDLVHLVKMQPSADRADMDLDGVPEEVLEDDPLDTLPEPGARRLQYLSQTSASESVYSTTTGPRASNARLQTLPNSTYAGPQPPQPSQPQRQPSPSSRTNGTANHRQQPSYASQSSMNQSNYGPSSQPPSSFSQRANGLESRHQQQASFASQASNQGRRPSFNSRDPPNGSDISRHRPQPSFTSQSSYNSQPSAAPAPLGGGGNAGIRGGAIGSNAFAERFGATSPVNLTGPGSGPGPLSPIPASGNGASRLGASPSPAAPSPAGGSRNMLSVPSPAGPAVSSAPDPAAAQLLIALDEESAIIIDSIQSLVTAIRTSQQPELVRARAATVAAILARIVSAAQRALEQSRPLQNSAVARIVDNLSMAQRRLGVADENAGSVIDRGEEKGDAWREVVRVFPPVAFEVAREVRELGAKVKEMGRGGAGDESEDDFR